MLRRVALVFSLAIHACAAAACPLCDTGTGQQVRAGIVDANFTLSLLAVLLPFAVVLTITAAIHFGFPRTRNSHDDPH